MLCRRTVGNVLKRSAAFSRVPTTGHKPRVARGRLKVFSGNAHPQLAIQITQLLDRKLSAASVTQFKNGEISVSIEESVRDCDVFIVQPVCNPRPNDYLMELIFMLDAVRRSGAQRVTAVLPIFGYARQDRKDESRKPISAKVVADMIQTAGADRVLAVELHAPQVQGFVNCPLDNLHGAPLIAQHILAHLMDDDPHQVCIVSPDSGGAKRADAMARVLQTGFAICSKKRERANVVESMTLVGDVHGKKCVIVDDMCDTGGSLEHCARVLLEGGATEVHAAVVHGVFSPPAMTRLSNSALKTMICMDTIPMDERRAECPKLSVVSVAPLLARAIHNIHTGDSLSSLFHLDCVRNLPTFEYPLKFTP